MGNTTVTGANGQTVVVPFVHGQTVDNADTTSGQAARLMPPVRGLLKPCGTATSPAPTPTYGPVAFVPPAGTLQSWGDLYDCVTRQGAAWYAHGVDKLRPYTGFGWADVKAWAGAKLPDGKTPESRVIFLSGSKTSLTDVQARTAVENLVGKDAAQRLQVVRFRDSAFLNTWRTPGSQPDMTDFADYGDEVRVTLVPLVLNADGTVRGLNGDLWWSGVFVDCYNDHGRYPRVPRVPTPPRPPHTNPPTHPGGGKHANLRPKPREGDVVTAPRGGYVDRNGRPHGTPYRAPVQTGNGQGDSGRGAINTVPPAQVPRPSSTASVPKTDSPHTNPPAEPSAG